MTEKFLGKKSYFLWDFKDFPGRNSGNKII